MLTNGIGSNSLHTSILRADSAASKSIQRISSGKKIGQASDNPAGSEMLSAFDAQARAMTQMMANQQSQASVLQTASSSLTTSTNILQSLSSLTAQAANGTLTDQDRAAIQQQINKTRYKDNPCGKIIGRHEGAQFYTIGQRKGLAIGGHVNPMFVISTDVDSNIIYVGEGEGHPGLFRKCLRVAPDEIHWIRPDLSLKAGENMRCRVRIRYRQPLQEASLLMRENGLFIVFDEEQRSITSGQFAVWYADDGEMLGSGAI